jgi:hypothetical protein
MDDMVRAALKKWPNVPACTGWLALDARGDWYMRDARIQARGPFPDVKGSRIEHEKLREFIERNYEATKDGQWFFQNGPQRVYVELAYTPWIVRLHAADGVLRLTDQAGAAFEPAQAYIDDEGGILFSDDASPARVAAMHDHDLELFANHASLDDAGKGGIFHWRDGVDLPVQPIARADVATRFGFVASPANRAAAKKD